MKADKKDFFKKVVKLAADENPAADFTASVMKTIEADLQRETALKALLQAEEVAGPSFNFTASVMAGIKASRPQFVYRPIITKKAWYGIAFLLLTLVIIVAASNGAANGDAGQTRVSFVIDYITQIPTIYIMAMVVVVLLLAADYLVGKASTNKTANSAA